MKVLELANKHPRIVVALLLSVLVAAVLVIAVPLIGSSINEARIGKLEQEKQEALKRAEEAEKRDLILQGQIQAKDQQISDLTSRIAESDQKVVVAHNETQSARATVNKVRTSAPHFNSADDAGRVSELRSVLDGLYRNSNDSP